MPAASAAFRSSATGAILNARSRSSLFICSSSKIARRPLYPPGASGASTGL
jgi:hypothetical protein